MTQKSDISKELSILDSRTLSERYFFPRREIFEEPFWVESGEVRLSCYYSSKFPDAKTVIFFHGNGEVVPDYFELFIPVFDEMRINLFFAEYRGYAMSTGIPGLRCMLGDVEKIVKSIGREPENIVLFGRSLGSLYAVHGAYLFPNIAGLIIESGIAHLLERVLMRISPEELGVGMSELEKAVMDDFDHEAKLAAFKGSTLVMHTLNDSMVPSSNAVKLHGWAPEPKYLRLFETGDHNDIMSTNYREYFQLIYSFISNLK